MCADKEPMQESSKHIEQCTTDTFIQYAKEGILKQLYREGLISGEQLFELLQLQEN